MQPESTSWGTPTLLSPQKPEALPMRTILSSFIASCFVAAS